MALASVVAVLAKVAEGDCDRYARAYAVDALASLMVLWHTQSMPEGDAGRVLEAAAAHAVSALTETIAPEHVNGVLNRCKGCPPNDVDDLIRWVCCRRWCPLTTEESPM